MKNKQKFLLILFLSFFLLLPLLSSDKDLIIQDIKVGNGQVAYSGSNVTVHYVGRLKNGTKFDSSRDRKRPFEFNLGAREVIRGWDKGIVGMKEGGIRKLTIPPDMAYGDKATGSIPANSTLIFEVELIKVY
ncbi:FKBP-type peptidyl-prolyl cis-trans isomerase [Leptospira ognonensis]|uniref:Peptidyl-prolyl cis-trans isomerase n=1 Tax=Leptospira ognonensis TaxID=2484945 RepID=A0A4R9K7E1_9LEPT|nr:FKBP-type peptidyl-prolyl cis-trans isomerase [Leptospira ognonensis]TGL62225.1 FKBP-type peptidyl-prolyl cis-trans isomerase [Leptospira ognonensis]